MNVSEEMSQRSQQEDLNIFKDKSQNDSSNKNILVIDLFEQDYKEENKYEINSKNTPE
jgi:hypothetical protein